MMMNAGLAVLISPSQLGGCQVIHAAGPPKVSTSPFIASRIATSDWLITPMSG